MGKLKQMLVDSTPFELETLQRQHEVKAKQVDRFFTDETSRTADALLFGVGFEITLEPKE